MNSRDEFSVGFITVFFFTFSVLKISSIFLRGYGKNAEKENDVHKVFFRLCIMNNAYLGMSNFNVIKTEKMVIKKC